MTQRTLSRTRPFGILAAALGMVLIPATAGACAQATAAPAADAQSTARCIAARGSAGTHVFRASDGSYRVVAPRMRGGMTAWTVREADGTIAVTQAGGKAGTARHMKGACY